MKRALDLQGAPHLAVDYIQEGVAGGWRFVVFLDGAEARMTTAELHDRYGVAPYENVNSIWYDDGEV